MLGLLGVLGLLGEEGSLKELELSLELVLEDTSLLSLDVLLPALVDTLGVELGLFELSLFDGFGPHAVIVVKTNRLKIAFKFFFIFVFLLLSFRFF